MHALVIVWQSYSMFFLKLAVTASSLLESFPKSSMFLSVHPVQAYSLLRMAKEEPPLNDSRLLQKQGFCPWGPWEYMAIYGSSLVMPRDTDQPKKGSLIPCGRAERLHMPGISPVISTINLLTTSLWIFLQFGLFAREPRCMSSTPRGIHRMTFRYT